VLGCFCCCSSSSSSSSSFSGEGEDEDEGGREGGLLSFLLLLSVVAVYILSPSLCLSGAGLVRGRRQHALVLALALALSLVLAAVGSAIRKGAREGGTSCAPTGGREGGRGGEVLLLVVCGASTTLSLLLLYWYPSWMEKRRGGREGGREGEGDEVPLRRPLLTLLSEEEEGGEGGREGGGEGGGRSYPTHPPSSSDQQLQRCGHSRRLKLLVSFLALSMLITLSRSVLDLLPSSSSSSPSSSSYSPFLFLDLAMFALISPVLWCLYGLDKELVVFQVLRKGGMAVGRVCGMGREGGRAHVE